MHVLGTDLLVEDPGVGRASIKERPYFLWWFVTHVDLSNIREIHVIVHVQSETTTALLRVLIELTLVHELCLVLLHKTVYFSCIGFMLLLFFYVVSHILGEEVVV